MGYQLLVIGYSLLVVFQAGMDKEGNVQIHSPMPNLITNNE